MEQCSAVTLLDEKLQWLEAKLDGLRNFEQRHSEHQQSMDAITVKLEQLTEVVDQQHVAAHETRMELHAKAESQQEELNGVASALKGTQAALQTEQKRLQHELDKYTGILISKIVRVECTLGFTDVPDGQAD